MSVGVPLLDADHKIFIEIINDLEQYTKYPARRDSIKDALHRLLEYSRYHFDREEAVMAACGYPGIESHKQEHGDFARYIGEVVLRFDGDPDAVLGDAVLDGVKNWLTRHVLIQDLAYRPYAENNAAADAAARAFHPLYVDAL